MTFFYDFYCDFRFSHSTANLEIVVSNRIAGVFKRFGATQSIAFRFHMLTFFTNSSYMEFGLRCRFWPCHFLVIDDILFGLFKMQSLNSSITLMQIFLKTLFVILHLSIIH